jgi:rhamnosyl/mannosyltransferase
MRVLHLYKDYFPILGGIENHIKLLAEGLRTRGVDAQVLVTNTTNHTVEEIINGVPVHKMARQVNISSAPVSLPFFPAVRRLEAETDIAHLHMPYPPGELAHLLLGRSRRLVASYHSDIVRQRALGALYRPFLWQILRRIDLIAVSTPTYIQDSPFLRRYAAKCRVVPYGVDLDRFAATPALAAQAARWQQRYHHQPLLLFVGRMRHYKGVDVLLSAMQQIPNAHALLVGIGPLAETWQAQMHTLGVADRVTFLGEVPDADIVALYHAAAIFVLPSTNRAETLGIVQLEAMACGVPLICTELGTGTSYVNQHGKTGIVAPPNDPDALAAAIRTLLASPQLRHVMGEAGRARAQEHFSIPAMLQKMLGLYAEALDLRKSGD